MAIYTVSGSQNLYDISLHLYGTIEGMFDLLISNPDLNLNSKLENGQELEYHENFVINPSIVEQFNEQNIVPSNGERSVYYKEIEEPLKVIFKTPSLLTECRFSISGEGVLIIDWDDNSEPETIELSHTQTVISHYFNNKADSRRIRWYGDFSILQLDLSKIESDMFVVRPIVVDEYISRSNDSSLAGLFLFEGIYDVDLQRMYINDLSPLYEKSLSKLNLLDVKFSDVSVLDSYLIYIAANYQDRRACEVFLNTEPSEKGIQAIDKIINEPAWNTPTKWVFHINDRIYTAE